MFVVRGEFNGNDYQMSVPTESVGLKIMKQNIKVAERMDLILDGSEILYTFDKNNKKGITKKGITKKV